MNKSKEEKITNELSKLTEFIDIENEFINTEHELSQVLYPIKYFLESKAYRIAPEMEDLMELNDKLSSQLLKMDQIIETNALTDLKFVKNEEDKVNEIQEGIKVQNWKVIKQNISKEKGDEKHALKLEHTEIKLIHNCFKEILKIIKKSKFMNSEITNEAIKKEKEYFIQIQQFFEEYDKIFKQLYDKEKTLSKKI